MGGTPAPYHQHTSTQRVSWPPSCSLTSTTSIPDPRELDRPGDYGVASKHVPKTRWPGTVQTRPRTSRLLQLPLLVHQARPDHLKPLQARKTAKSSKNRPGQQQQYKTGTPGGQWINRGSPFGSPSDSTVLPHPQARIDLGTTGTASEVSRKSTKDHQRITKGLNTLKPPKTSKTTLHLQGQQEINQGSPTEDHQGTQHTQTPGNRKTALQSLLAVWELHVAPGKPGKFWKFWKPSNHPVHRAGAAIMAHTYPLICGACSYLTTRKAPPETPCSTPLVWTRRPEWLILTRAKGPQVSIRFTPKPKKTIKNYKTIKTGINRNKLEKPE